MVFCCEVMTSSIKADDARGNSNYRRSNGLWLIYLKGIPTNAVEQAMPVRFGGASKVYVCLFNRTMRSKICCLDSYCLGGKSVDHSFKMSYAV